MRVVTGHHGNISASQRDGFAAFQPDEAFAFGDVVVGDDMARRRHVGGAVFRTDVRVERPWGRELRFQKDRAGQPHAAQRDIIDLTLMEAALRGGQDTLAESLAYERLALKPRSLTNHGFLARSRQRAAARKAA